MVVGELQRAVGSPEVRSGVELDHTHGSFVSRSGSVDKHVPDKNKMDNYWDIYKEIPIIRHPIRAFASEVVGPGYYVDADDEELKEEIEGWLGNCAIVDGEIDKDFTLLLKKSQIQREVKGTALSEKVKDDNENLYGFKLMRPETVSAYTRPGQSVLLPPDFEVEKHEESDGIMSRVVSNNDYYRTSDGDIAAYVQLDERISGGNETAYIAFTRNDIIKLTRDADVGEIFGEGRISAVEDRLESLLKKLEDNDKAIESIAHPFQLIQFGNEDDVWSPQEIQSFMDQHSQSEFEPGMKQGVQGDVSIDTVSGEVAPIEEFLQFDLNWIISEMPLPKYALGGFEEDVNQFVSRSQETRIEKQIEEARKEIEEEWTPVLKEKAEELGYDPDDLNRLVIGEDPANLNLVEETKEQNEGDNVPDGNNSNEENVGASGTDFERPPASSESEREES